LAAEGLFDSSRKRPLPLLPRKIGLVTSLDGAAVRDILKVLGRRYSNAHVVIRPARVQGDGAAREIARGIRTVTRVAGVDVVIVGRGGGSIEDLWAFNDELVARAIASAGVPIISAVGHETDFTIADFVADVRAPTPSAAAELVVARKEEFYGRIDRLVDRLQASARTKVQRLSRHVHMLSGRSALAGFPARLALRGRHAAELTYDLSRRLRSAVALRARQLQQAQQRLDTLDLRRRLQGIRTRLVTVDNRLSTAMANRRNAADRRLRGCAGRLDALSPLAVLGRGYAVCWNADRTRIVRAALDVEVGETVRVTVSRGEIEAKVSGRT
jgi:exodeoxyribonuclease VII large subunit